MIDYTFDGNTGISTITYNDRVICMKQDLKSRQEAAEWMDLFIEKVKSIEKMERALKATLLFHSGGPFDAKEWEALTEGREATSRKLCDFVREVLK